MLSFLLRWKAAASYFAPFLTSFSCHSSSCFSTCFTCGKTGACNRSSHKFWAIGRHRASRKTRASVSHSTPSSGRTRAQEASASLRRKCWVAPVWLKVTRASLHDACAWTCGRRRYHRLSDAGTSHATHPLVLGDDTTHWHRGIRRDNETSVVLSGTTPSRAKMGRTGLASTIVGGLTLVANRYRHLSTCLCSCGSCAHVRSCAIPASRTLEAFLSVVGRHPVARALRQPRLVDFGAQ